MAGSRETGLKAKEKLLKQDPDYFRKLGKKGGAVSSTGGFATRTICNCDVIQEAHTKPQCRGRLGGTKSRRGKLKK